MNQPQPCITEHSEKALYHIAFLTGAAFCRRACKTSTMGEPVRTMLKLLILQAFLRG